MSRPQLKRGPLGGAVMIVALMMHPHLRRCSHVGAILGVIACGRPSAPKLDGAHAARSPQQVDSAHYARWLTARSTPATDTVDSIPIHAIDPSSAKASVLTAHGLPQQAA